MNSSPAAARIDENKHACKFYISFDKVSNRCAWNSEYGGNEYLLPALQVTQFCTLHSALWFCIHIATTTTTTKEAKPHLIP